MVTPYRRRRPNAVMGYTWRVLQRYSWWMLVVVVHWTIRWDFRNKVRCMSRVRSPIPMWMERLIV